jgi:hypothetical protein
MKRIVGLMTMTLISAQSMAMTYLTRVPLKPGAPMLTSAPVEVSQKKPATEATVNSSKLAKQTAAPAPVSPLVVQTHRQALRLANQGQVKEAIRALRSVVGAESINNFELDRAKLSLGRLLYEVGEFSQALEVYDRVEKHGSSWIEALEEKAWSELRLGKPQDAIAHLKTVTSPLYTDSVSSESYFTLGLAHLRLCDYPSVFKTLEQFKTRYREKVKLWESTSDSESQRHAREVSETIQKLNLVESEAIQRVYMEADASKSVHVPSVTKAKGQLSFPATDGDEIWFDEVDKYKVSVRGCDQLASQSVKATNSTNSNNSVGSNADNSKGRLTANRVSAK